MGDAQHIVYTPRSDAAPEAELVALASVYRFILDCRAKKEGGPPTTPKDDIKESSRYVARTNCNAS